MSESMLTYLDQCWGLKRKRHTPYASEMHSPNRLLSLKLTPRMLKQLLKQFLTTGFANSAFQRNFTLMEAKNLSTNYQQNCLNFSMCSILKHRHTTHNAMLKWKFSTRRSKSTWLLMWMNLHLTGMNGCQLSCSLTTPVITPPLPQHCSSCCLE